MNALKKIVPVSALLAPSLAFAAESTFRSILEEIGSILGVIVPILITVALAYFIYGVVKYIMAGEEGRKEAKDIIIYGVIGLFAIVSVWGLVRLIQNTFNVEDNSAIEIPTLPPIPGARQ